jgi:hypothetical protein
MYKCPIRYRLTQTNDDYSLTSNCNNVHIVIVKKRIELTTSFIFDLAFVAAVLGALVEGAKLNVACFEPLAAVFLAGVFFVAGWLLGCQQRITMKKVIVDLSTAVRLFFFGTSSSSSSSLSD